MASRKKTLIYLFIVTLLCITNLKTVVANHNYTKNSVLSEGKWVKIMVSETGIYKLTYDQIKDMGFSDPSKIKLYGYGGNMINEDITQKHIYDLPEIPIWLNKKDGSFNAGDYILFYTKGPVEISKDNNSNIFSHINNPYSNEAFLFLTEGNNGKRLELITPPVFSEDNKQELDWFIDYIIHENDLINLAESGTEFYGETFKINKEKTFSFNIPNGFHVDRIATRFISKTAYSADSYLTLFANDEEIQKEITPKIFHDYYEEGAYIDIDNFYNKAINNKLDIKLVLKAENPKAAYLDYIRIEAKRRLVMNGEPFTIFRNNNSKGEKSTFKIKSSSNNLMVWDVTDEVNPTQIETTTKGDEVRFNSEGDIVREYVMIDHTKEFKSPTTIGPVKNQNLHASEPVDMIIISRPTIEKEAKRLAKLHEKESNLTTLVVDPEDIYNEFSSGKPDASAYRKFLKLLYDKGTSENDRPKYLILFGDGVYDNKFIEKKWQSINKDALLLTYQKGNSLDRRDSYTTDDFFGFLTDNRTLNIAIGRLPVRNQREATDIVNKIKKYLENDDSGLWQNEILFAADDAISKTKKPEDERVHMDDTEMISEEVPTYAPQMIVNKIYLDSYIPKRDASGTKYPLANRDILNKLNSGQLIMCYLGHGATNELSEEGLLTTKDVSQLTNQKQGLWIASTCEFGQFDSFIGACGAKAAILNPKGGAIGIFTPSRPVYPRPNATLTSLVIKQLLTSEDTTIGEALRKAKNDNQLKHDSNKFRFSLFGDPALKLLRANDQLSIKTTKINGEVISKDTPVQIKALSKPVIEGEIVNKNGEIDTNFNGFIYSKVFDSKMQMTTRGNHPKAPKIRLTYWDYINSLYSGKVEVKDGRFKISFIVPKDIMYSENKGKISFLAKEEKGDKKACGYFDNYVVNGTEDNIVNDNTSPIIHTMYLNKETFNSGDKVNKTPILVAEISDDTGINLTKLVGNRIELTIKNKSNNIELTYDVADFYQADEKSTNRGEIKFIIPGLNKGEYNLKLKVWDIFKNVTTKDIDCIVTEDIDSEVEDFYIVGNPASETTTFVVRPNIYSNNINIAYSVYSAVGSLVWSHQEVYSNTSGSKELEYTWDLKQKNGSYLNSGLYICTVIIKNEKNQQSIKSKKLIIVKQ